MRVVISEGSNGLEAFKRNFDDGLLCTLDWYHATEYLHGYAKCLHQAEEEAQAWAYGAKTVLWEPGGQGLDQWLRGQAEPADAGTAEPPLRANKCGHSTASRKRMSRRRLMARPNGLRRE